MIVYPAIDIRNGRCVRLSQGRDDAQTSYYENPVEPAEQFKKEGAEWIHVVDLDGAFGGVPHNLNILKQISSLGPKVQFGGGMRDVQLIENALNAGASRIVIGTRAATDSAFLKQIAKSHGKKLAIGIDAKDGLVAVKGWTDVTHLKAKGLCNHRWRFGNFYCNLHRYCHRRNALGSELEITRGIT
jgi:phosphoribosylformimino-5-aminoimidazole carboxamide ribotide isomerase